MNLPTREEINVHDSLDERSACKNFLGKTLKQAEMLFRDDFLHYQEDLMWMGPTAFQFYVIAAIRYIKSSESKRDSDAINCFLGLLEFRLKYEAESLRPIGKELTETCRFIVERYDQFDVTPDIYGELRPRYEQLVRELSHNHSPAP
jgi:hypothetical protein